MSWTLFADTREFNQFLRKLLALTQRLTMSTSPSTNRLSLVERETEGLIRPVSVTDKRQKIDHFSFELNVPALMEKGQTMGVTGKDLNKSLNALSSYIRPYLERLSFAMPVEPKAKRHVEKGVEQWRKEKHPGAKELEQITETELPDVPEPDADFPWPGSKSAPAIVPDPTREEARELYRRAPNMPKEKYEREHRSLESRKRQRDILDSLYDWYKRNVGTATPEEVQGVIEESTVNLVQNEHGLSREDAIALIEKTMGKVKRKKPVDMADIVKWMERGLTEEEAKERAETEAEASRAQKEQESENRGENPYEQEFSASLRPAFEPWEQELIRRSVKSGIVTGR